MTSENKKSYMLDFGADDGASTNPFDAVVVNKTEVDSEQIEEAPSDIVEDDELEENADPIDEVDDIVEGSDDVEDDVEDDEGEEDYNVYLDIANELKQDNFIPDSFELSENLDGFSLKQGVKAALREELEPEIRQDIYNRLAQEGFVEADLIIARAYRQGVPPNLLSESALYRTYATLADDVPDSDKATVITQMYRSRGFDDSEIEVQLSRLKDEEGEYTDEFLNKYNESKKYFGQKYGEFEEQQRQRDAELQKAQEEELKNQTDIIKSVISSRKIGDIEMSQEQAKEFEIAISRPKIVEVNGQKYQATDLQKFIYEWQSNHELKLATFFLHLFKDTHREEVKKEVKKEVEKEFLQGYKTKKIRSKASKNKRRAALNTQPTSTNKNTMVLDFSAK